MIYHPPLLAPRLSRWSAWDPVTGLCGACGLPYRVSIVFSEISEARPVVPSDLEPTSEAPTGLQQVASTFPVRGPK